MTTFDDRERAFENKYAHDAEMQFRVTCRCNKLVGLWAAGLMGLTGQEAEDYAQTVVLADLEEPGPEDVYRKIRGDFDARGVAVAEADIRAKMHACMVDAKCQIMEEVG